VLLVVILAAGAMKFLRRQSDTIQDRAINRLLESSRSHESEGRLGEALVDLDAALQLARKAGPAWMKRLEQEQTRRPDLARRDAQGVLAGLGRNQSTPFRIGDWLNLIARAKRDPDLSALEADIENRFQASITAQLTGELALAQQQRASGNLIVSMNACDRTGALLSHLAQDKQPGFRQEIEALVCDLLKSAGITLVVPPVRFVYGSNTYVSEMFPVLDHALEAKGYLPRREHSPWRDLWRHSLYQMNLAVQEIQEGRYPGSENRLTLIIAELTLTSGDKEISQMTARARSAVPLPNLPANLARQIAVSAERSDEFEQLLYKSARDQIVQKFRTALTDMPSCPDRAVPNSPP
jgi:hypothetical protein